MYMANGNLEEYLKSCGISLSPSIKTRWMRDIVNTVNSIHGKKIVLLDLAPRNILVGQDQSVKLADFGNALILPMSVDLSVAQRDGFLSVQQDIFDLGWVLYSISVGKAHHTPLDRRYSEKDSEEQMMPQAKGPLCNEDNEPRYSHCLDYNKRGKKTILPIIWPQDLPDTTNVLCGSLILKCWTEQGYQNISQICADLDTVFNV